MAALPNMISDIRANCLDPTLLGTFTETHDVPRFAHYTQDLTLLTTVSTWNILSDGIPIVYQGQEQQYRGDNDPYNREAVWLSGYSTQTPLYLLLKFLNRDTPLEIVYENSDRKLLRRIRRTQRHYRMYYTPTSKQ
jgi:alpha-amylase